MARPSPGVDRVVAILNLLADDTDREFSLSELARRLDMTKATAHATLAALVDAGYLLRHPTRKVFSLGPALVRLGSAAASRVGDVVEHARGEMRALADELDLQVAASALLGHEVVVLAREGRARPFGVSVEVGSRIALLPPIGTIFLAWLSEADLAPWNERFAASDRRAGAEDFRQALQVVRERGYSVGMNRGDYNLKAIDPDGRYDVAHVVCPVFGPAGDVVLALTLFGFEGPLEVAELSAHAERLGGAARAATATIQGRRPVGA
ncbi:MAG: transcriptional regulator, IclR family [Actinomycetia bacterium]|nr:transcriptional regulator, IclR family [Actinomycetes bacterium]